MLDEPFAGFIVMFVIMFIVMIVVEVIRHFVGGVVRVTIVGGTKARGTIVRGEFRVDEFFFVVMFVGGFTGFRFIDDGILGPAGSDAFFAIASAATAAASAATAARPLFVARHSARFAGCRARIRACVRVFL